MERSFEPVGNELGWKEREMVSLHSHWKRNEGHAAQAGWEMRRGVVGWVLGVFM